MQKIYVEMPDNFSKLKSIILKNGIKIVNLNYKEG